MANFIGRPNSMACRFGIWRTQIMKSLALLSLGSPQQQSTVLEIFSNAVLSAHSWSAATSTVNKGSPDTRST